jgi:hypothetical protein
MIEALISKSQVIEFDVCKTSTYNSNKFAVVLQAKPAILTKRV